MNRQPHLHAPPPLHVAVLGSCLQECEAAAAALRAHCSAAAALHRPVMVHPLSPLLRQALGLDDSAPDSKADAAGDSAQRTHARSIRHKARYGLTLLLGRQALDPAPSDLWLRDTLSAADIAYQVLHGSSQERAHQGFQAILALAGRRPPAAAMDKPPAPPSTAALVRLRAWGCEKCSDPECEHQLFRRLLQSR